MLVYFAKSEADNNHNIYFPYLYSALHAYFSLVNTKNFMHIFKSTQRWANSVLMTEYEYEYYSTFKKNQKKSLEYEYEY